MASPEHGDSEHDTRPTDTIDLYELAARFSTERAAHRAYFRAQELVFAAPCDLSVTRFLLDRVAHVAVIGITPPEDVDRRLRRLLRAGELTSLSEEVLLALWERRLQANQEAPWVERHWRPGQLL